VTTKNKKGLFVLRSEGCFGGWLLAIWEGRVCLDAGMGKKKEK
jgi:hypothetical protein